MSLDLTGGHAATPGADDHARGPSPGKVSRSERLPARRGAEPGATTAPVQADGGLAAIDDPFALHLGRGSSPALVVQCDGGVGAAGDAHEHHAEAVAAAVVRGESAEALLDAGAAGAPAVQRDPLTPDARRAAQAHAVSDVVLEQIAHRIAYSDGRPPHEEGSRHAHTALRSARAGMSDADPHLDAAGHTDDEVALSELGFAIDQFQYFSGEGGLQFWILPTRPDATVTPVIAFRGTEGDRGAGEAAEDVGEDFNGAGVGMAQFTMNQGAIRGALDRLGGHGVIATGHSLGGALAQIAACMYPELIVSVITFQAPGIPASVVARLRDLPRDEHVAARHHRVDGCIVDGAGEAFVPGEVELYGEGAMFDTTLDIRDVPLLGAAVDHTTFPVLAGAEAHGTAESWMEGATMPALAAEPRHSVTSDDSAGRELAIGGLSETVRHGVDSWVREAYANVWMEILPYADEGGRTFEQLKTTILTRCRAERIPSYAGRMRTNLGQLFPEYPVTDAVVRAGGDAVASIDAFLAAVGAQVPLDDERRLRVRNIYLTHGFTIAEGHDPVFGDGGIDAPAETVHAHAARGVSGGGGALPHLAAIQESFGHHDVTGVRAHVGGVAADAAQAIGAAAYATGDDVAFAGAPDLRQAAHEAAHVVQQRGGVRLDGGVGRAGDPYERHADDVAALVTRGESAEALLDTMAHRGATGGPAVQRLVAEGHGAFTAIMYRIGMATPEQLAALRAQVETELSQGQPILPLSFMLGRERFEVQLDRADGGPLLEAIDGVAAGERRERRRVAAHEAELRVPDLTSIGATIADLIGIAGGEVGHGQELTVSLNVPLTPAISAAVRLRLGVEHQRDGFRAAAEVLGGLRLGTREAHGELLAGLRLEATGTTAERTAELLGAALGDAIRRATAGLIDGAEGAVTHHDADDIMTHAGDHEGVDAAVPLTVGGGLASPEHDEFGVELEGSAGTSLHTAAEGSADGAAPISFQAFDLDLRTTVGPFGLHLAASIPFRSGPLLPGEHMPAPSLEFEFSGELDLETARAALTAAVVDTALRLLLAAIATARGERVVDTGFAARVRAAASLGCSTIGAHLDGLAATSGDAAMSLTLGLKFQGEETEVSVRTARTADPVPEAARGVVDVEWGAATSVWRERL